MACETYNSTYKSGGLLVQLPSTDVNVAALRKLKSLLPDLRFAGWVLDERKAYRQNSQFLWFRGLLCNQGFGQIWPNILS